MVILPAEQVVRLLRQVHVCEIVVRLEQLLQGVPDKPGLLLKGADPLRQDQENPQLVTVDVVLKLGEDANHGVADSLEVRLQLRRHRHEHGFERAEFVGEVVGARRLLLLQLPLQLVHERRLGVRRRRAVDIKQEHPIVLDQDL